MKHFFVILLAVTSALIGLAGNNYVVVEDFEIMGDSALSVPVYLVNEDPSRGFQFNMTLPAGLTLEDCTIPEEVMDDFDMRFVCNYMSQDSCFQIIIFPGFRVCIEPGTMLAIYLDFIAASDFKGGKIKIWKCLGSTIDNETFPMNGCTVNVTVPASSLIKVPVDTQPSDERYFNLMGHPLSSPANAPVAILVSTMPDGRVSSRKVSVGH
jgi:hypothetical protein